MEPETQELAQRNEERLSVLMSGALGGKFALAPGTVENLRTFSYLEVIAEALGCVDTAERKLQDRISGLLDGIEAQAGSMILTQGVSEGMAHSIDPRNREQRRQR